LFNLCSKTPFPFLRRSLAVSQLLHVLKKMAGPHVHAFSNLLARRTARAHDAVTSVHDAKNFGTTRCSSPCSKLPRSQAFPCRLCAVSPLPSPSSPPPLALPWPHLAPARRRGDSQRTAPHQPSPASSPSAAHAARLLAASRA
jgi:hypothetical protein